MLTFQTTRQLYSSGRFFGQPLAVINALLMFYVYEKDNTWQNGIDAETATNSGL